MKNIFYNLIAVPAMIFMLASCTTYTKIAIHGEPGTEIFGNGVESATIPSDGVLHTKISDKVATRFLYAKEPDSDFWVPFALDYKPLSRNTERVALWSFTLPSIFVTEVIIVSRDEQPAYKGNYVDLPQQHTISDIQFTRPNLTYVPIEKSNASEKSQNKAGTQRISRNMSGKVKTVSGVYNGDGTIVLNGEIVDNLKGVTVEINPLPDQQATVRVIEENGNDFFGEAVPYKIEQAADGNVLLRHNTISNATVEISPSGQLKFVHPAIDIDGSVYTLNIKGNMK